MHEDADNSISSPLSPVWQNPFARRTRYLPRRHGMPCAQDGRTSRQQQAFQDQCARYHAKRKFAAWWERVTLAEATRRRVGSFFHSTSV